MLWADDMSAVSSFRRMSDDVVRELMDALAVPGLSTEHDLMEQWNRRVGDAIAALRDVPPLLVRAAAGEVARGPQAWTLLGWAEGMLSRSLRQRQPQLLNDAAFAIVLLDDGSIDTRDLWIVVSLLKVAAGRLHVPFEACVDAALAAAGADRAVKRRLFDPPSDRLPSTHRMVGWWPRRTFRRNMVGFDADEMLRQLGRLGE